MTNLPKKPFLAAIGVVLLFVIIGLTSDETPSTKGSPQVRTKTYHLIPFLETEGEINVNDCRRKIWKDSRPLSFRKYTCSVDRNSEGKIISSICCRVDYASFSNECRTAYCYTKGGRNLEARISQRY